MTLSTNSSQILTSNDVYIANTDQAELNRLQALSGVAGVGDTLYDDVTEFGDMLNGEFGVGK